MVGQAGGAKPDFGVRHVRMDPHGSDTFCFALAGRLREGAFPTSPEARFAPLCAQACATDCSQCSGGSGTVSGAGLGRSHQQRFDRWRLSLSISQPVPR
jgi:hypothetical protein